MRLGPLIEKLSTLEGDARFDDQEGPRAAVGAILREKDGEAELLFIVRAEREGDLWSGHVAFPGGKRSGADGSLRDTAIRETREEVGIALDASMLVGRLPDIPAFTRSQKYGTLVVAAFVFALREDVALVPNLAEVAETMWIPVSSLATGTGPALRAMFPWKWEGREMELPCFHLGPDKRVLWGLTYRMVETILESLGPADDSPGPSK